MMTAVKKMKENGVIFPNVNHITCLVHGINLVCKSIQEDFTLVNLLVKETKKFFRNSPKRKRAFKDSSNLKSLPPFPVQVRFGSWLKCVNWFMIGGNWEKFKEFFLDNDSNELGGGSTHLATIKKIFSGKKIESDLIQVSRFVVLTNVIKRFEAEGLSKDKQFELIEKVKEVVNGTMYQKRFDDILSNNPDLYSFF